MLDFLVCFLNLLEKYKVEVEVIIALKLMLLFMSILQTIRMQNQALVPTLKKILLSHFSKNE